MFTFVFGFGTSAFADDAANATLQINTDAAAQTKAFAEIKQMFADKKPMAEIRAKYAADFENGVKAIDTAIAADNPKINDSIKLVLENAVDETPSIGQLHYAQAQQAVDKGLQWYFYMLLKDFINKQAKPAIVAGDKAAATTALEKAQLIYTSAIDPTTVKRDNKFKTTMSDLLNNTVFPALKQDVEKMDVNAFDLHRQMLDKTIIKMYTLATLTYAESIPTKADADKPAAMTEGYFFYMSVYPYLKGGSAKDADYVYGVFASGDASKVNTARISKALQRTLTAKVSEYGNQVLVKLAAGEQNSANVYAMEGAMFLAAHETFLGSAYAEVYADMQQLVEAGAKGDAKAVSAELFAVASALSKLDGISFHVGKQEVTVAGKVEATDRAAFIHKTSNRTLVPTTFLEKLGFTVAYDGAAKAITLSKDGDTYVLTQGKDTVVKNGETVTDKKLDQPVVTVNGITYLPIRAIAELSGNHVYYTKGQIVIIK